MTRSLNDGHEYRLELRHGGSVGANAFALPSGIIVMTAIYTVNLRVMGRANTALLDTRSVFDDVARGLAAMGLHVRPGTAATIAMTAVALAVVALALGAFFRTDLGLAVRATGENEGMIRALGVDTDRTKLVGLALSNGVIALSGALLAQYQGFADVQMGIGMVVWGLASVIIGEALVGTRQLGFIITGAVMGSVLFRLLVAIALRGGLNPNDLKLITAVFVFVALVLPTIVSKAAGARRGRLSGSGV